MLLVPTFVLLTCHWYDGVVPPLVGVAVYVTLVPEQTAPDGAAAMLTLTGNVAVTSIVRVFEVAGLPVTQLRSDVITQ